MLWIITKRQVVLALHKARWKNYYEYPTIMDSRTSDYRMYGVPKEEFLDDLWKEEMLLGLSLRKPFYFIISHVYTRFRPLYIEQFNPRVEDTIRKCINDGYIDVLRNNRLVLSSKGGAFISSWYYPQLILRHPLTLAFMKYFMPVLAIGLMALFARIKGLI